MQLDPIDIGPFELHTCVGSGGMGEVWHGQHRALKVPVAVKLIRGAGGRHFTHTFRNEVRQVAKLDHPGIIRILDYGETEAGTEARSGGKLPDGVPYFAMEFASGGSLADQVRNPPDYLTVRTLLTALLAGLAHAHARGVLHRDLSPRNVLFCSPSDPRPGLKLADFGLARASGSPGVGLADGGTPAYMAPEQFGGDEAAQGPWTDLYGLGCLAWEMVAGAPPFPGRTTRDFQRAHAASPLPPLLARRPVSEGFEGWLLRLLAKDPAHRFRFAADAARSLLSLPDPTAGTTLPTTSDSFELSGPHGETSDTAFDVAVASDVPLLIPQVWREPLRSAHPLVGVGLGLTELRILPLVNRQDQGNHLWEALRGVWLHRTPALVVLTGAMGHGKTHLSRSIAWRAHELCGAELWTVAHAPLQDRASGIRQTVATALHCVGATPEARLAHIARFLDAFGADNAEERAAVVRFLDDRGDMPVTEQHALVARLIGLLGRTRPVVLSIEDLQWGPDSDDLVRHLLREPLPLLIVATVDGADERTAPQVTTLAVGPLSDADQHALLETLLRLDPSLCDRVVERTGGSPLFAQRLVERWVRDGALMQGATGYLKTADATDDLPDSLHQLWIGTVDQALAGRPDAARTALHLACALGMEVAPDDWRDALLNAGNPTSAIDLADILCATQLFEAQPGGLLRFAHALVWESVRRDAIERGSWEVVHRACADMMASRESADLGRLGLHRLASGDAKAAVAPLLDGARRALDTGAFARATALLDRRDEALTAAGVDPMDAAFGEGRLLRARAWLGRGAFARAQQLASSLCEDARKHRWKHLLPEALRVLGLGNLKLGKLLDAEAMFALAMTTAAGVSGRDARITVAHCLMYRGTLLRIRGVADEAVEVLTESRAQFEALEHSAGMADCDAELGNAWFFLPDGHEKSILSTEAAMQAYVGLGNTVGEATCLNTLGDLHRKAGRLDHAEQLYRQAVVKFDRVGSDARLFPRLNLGVVRLSQDDVTGADAWFAEAQDLIVRAGRTGLVATAHLCRLPGAAARGDWAAWDAHLEAAAVAGSPKDPDALLIVAAARSLALAAGEQARADRLPDAPLLGS